MTDTTREAPPILKRLVVTDQSFGGTPAAVRETAASGAQFESHQVSTEDDTVAVTAGADVVLVQYARISRRVLESLAPGATVIRYGIGYDNIDVTAAHELGVAVAVVPDYGVDTVADHAVALLLATLRRVADYDRLLRESRGFVDPQSFGPIAELASTTVGLIGTGRIGLAVAHRLRAFGVTLLAYDPFADPQRLAALGIASVPLDDLLQRADAVTLHAPATPDTIGIIDARALSLMKRTAVLVNTARGVLVDSDALAGALSHGQIAAAAVDVVDPEPLPEDSPLWSAPNLLMTPHVGFYSTQSLERLERLAAEEAGRALRGEALRCPVPVP